MLVAVWQHGQKACTFNSGVDLALENCACAGQTGRNDLAVFSHKVTQGVDVFVVKRQKRLRLNSRDCVLRLGRLSLLKRFGPGMMDSLNWGYLFDGLNMENKAFAGACVDQKTGEYLELA